MSSEFVKYEISGYIDEKAIFPSVELRPEIFIELKDVAGLNSVGTRSWCFWVKQMALPSKIYIDHCPLLFVKSFNQVFGSLTSNMIIKSFIVPYYAPLSNETKHVLFQLGTEYTPIGKINYPIVRDSKGQLMEPDVIDQYFEFLKK